MTGKVKESASTIKRDVHAIYLAARDPRIPWYVKALALCVAGYALSPIDMIPDFIPVLGYLDDVIIVPLGIVAVVKLIPPQIMAERRAAATIAARRPVSRLKVRRRRLRRNGALSLSPWEWFQPSIGVS